MNRTLLSIPILLCLLSASALPQRPTYPKAPPSMDPDTTAPPPPTLNFPRRINLQQLQKEADDLALTAQTIPADVASVRKGMLPKDIIQKLKQIEKLSKHLRTELNQ
jgi:hypothetical protein